MTSMAIRSGRRTWASKRPVTASAKALRRPFMAITSSSRGTTKLGGTGDLTGTPNILWRVDRSTPYVPSPLLSGNRIYFYASNMGVLSCHDIVTGEAHYSSQRVDGLGNVYPSPVAAAGRVYL